MFGIIHVLRFAHPALLITGAVTVVGALSVVVMIARDAVPQALRTSTALSILAIPLSVVLAAEDHGSAPTMAAASTIAAAISLWVMARRTASARGRR